MRKIVSRMAVAAGIIGFFGSQRSAGAFCNDHNPFCDGGGHQGVTAVLGFLNDEVVGRRQRMADHRHRTAGRGQRR